MAWRRAGDQAGSFGGVLIVKPRCKQLGDVALSFSGSRCQVLEGGLPWVLELMFRLASFRSFRSLPALVLRSSLPFTPPSLSLFACVSLSICLSGWSDFPPSLVLCCSPWPFPSDLQWKKAHQGQSPRSGLTVPGRPGASHGLGRLLCSLSSYGEFVCLHFCLLCLLGRYGVLPAIGPLRDHGPESPSLGK